ncbi:MAG: hypothetical protein L6R37_007891 [Teloschistes peruensis]|nr:MAG: hypothetical protein L6R37_007891 [Teloschistes peruensis]
MNSTSMALEREAGEHREHSRNGNGDGENLKVEPKMVRNNPRRRVHNVEGNVDKLKPILEDIIILQHQALATLQRENADLNDRVVKVEASLEEQQRRLDHLEEKQQHKAEFHEKVEDVAKIQGESAQPSASKLLSNFRMSLISTTMNTNNAAKSTMPINTMAECPIMSLMLREAEIGPAMDTKGT